MRNSAILYFYFLALLLASPVPTRASVPSADGLETDQLAKVKQSYADQLAAVPVTNLSKLLPRLQKLADQGDPAAWACLENTDSKNELFG